MDHIQFPKENVVRDFFSGMGLGWTEVYNWKRIAAHYLDPLQPAGFQTCQKAVTQDCVKATGYKQSLEAI